MFRRLFPASALSHSRPSSLVRRLASMMEGRPMYNRMVKKVAIAGMGRARALAFIHAA